MADIVILSIPSIGFPFTYTPNGPVGPAGPTGAIGPSGATGLTGPGCTVDPVLRNLFCGASAGANNTTGADNTFLGDHAGFTNTSMSSNVFIGSQAGVTMRAPDNIIIGSNAEGRTSTTRNELVLGSVSHPIFEMELGPNMDIIFPISTVASPGKETTLYTFPLGLGETASMEVTVALEALNPTDRMSRVTKYMFSAVRNVAGTSLKTSPVSVTGATGAFTAGTALTMLPTSPPPFVGNVVSFNIFPISVGLAGPVTMNTRTRVVNLSLTTKIPITPLTT